MHLTRWGRLVLLAAGLTLFAAMGSGNNLLYLVYSMLAASLIVSYLINRLNLSRLDVRVAFPEQIFQNTEFPLSLTIRNNKIFPSLQIKILSGGHSQFLSTLPGRQAAELTLPFSFLYRGKNRMANVYLETLFPFGLFWRRKKIPDCTGLSFPKIYEIFDQKFSPAISEEQVSLPKRGVGDDFHGLREYKYGEDSRLINWKLTAKTGKPLVKEYAQWIGNRITVTVDGTPGPQTEERISEAASLAKFFVDSGAEVRLKTNEGEIDYGKGLLQLSQILKKLALLGIGKEIKATRSLGPPQRPSLKFFAKKSALLSAYLTTTIVYISLFLVEELSPGLLFPFAFVLPLGWLLEIKKLSLLPKRLWDIASGIYLLLFLFVDLAFSGVLLAVIHLLLFIIVYLLLQPKQEYHLKLLFLTNFMIFFLVSGQAVNISYFVFFVLYFLSSAIWLVQWQDPHHLSRKTHWLRHLTAIVVMSIFLAAISFILTPRIYNPRMQQLLAGTGLNRLGKVYSFSGLTESVQLGYFGDLKKNSTRVMRVRFSGSVEDANRPFFFRVRAGAFDSFDGKRWRKTSAEFRYRYSDRIIATRNNRAWLRKDGRMIYLPNFNPQKPSLIEEFYINPLFTALMFTAEGMSAVETDAPSAYFDFTETVHFPFIYTESTRYRVYSQPGSSPLYEAIENYDQLLKDKFLQLPASKEKIRQLAKKMTDPFPEPLAKAQILESYLQNEFSYSLSASYGQQDLENFLFKSQAGNCEYFATALCLLLRSLDIPARLTIGFLSTDWNEYGQFFDIRQSDAHAWVEAFIPGQGWRTFDPTPVEMTSPGTTFVLWSKINKFFSAIEMRWYRYVMGYDLFIQRNFFYNFRIHFERHLVTIFIWLAILSGLALVFYYLKPWKTKIIWAAKKTKTDNFYYVLLNRLEKAGFRRELWQTGKEFAEEVARIKPELKPLSILTEYFYLIRYAGQNISVRDEQTIQHTLRQIQDVLKNPKRARSLSSAGIFFKKEKR